MQYYNAGEAQSMYDEIYIERKDSPFCDDCLAELQLLLNNFYIEANNGGNYYG